MPHYIKTKVELEKELQEQIEALRDSAAAYDSSKLWEAKRLAGTAYILVHDSGKNSRSLLTQLGLKDMLYTSTVGPSDSPLPLGTIQINIPAGTCTYAPFLDAAPMMQSLKFSKWYKERVFVTGTGKPLSRMNLIFALRNQMGGGHVDPEIKDEAFHWLATGDHKISVGPVTDAEGNIVEDNSGLFGALEEGNVPNGHLATMRQIAWELDHSLRAQGL